MDLSQIATEFKAHFQAVEAEAQKYLAEHIPAVEQWGQKIEASPLLKAAETVLAVLSPEAEAVLAKFVTDFAALVPAPAPAETAADPAMGEPQQPEPPAA